MAAQFVKRRSNAFNVLLHAPVVEREVELIAFIPVLSFFYFVFSIFFLFGVLAFFSFAIFAKSIRLFNNLFEVHRPDLELRGKESLRKPVSSCIDAVDKEKSESGSKVSNVTGSNTENGE